MRKISTLMKWIVGLLIITFVCIPVITFSQNVHVESWEVRHNNKQPPVKIMDAIGLKEGMTIGDIGAGTGRFTVWFSDRVGETGKVYANDIDQDALNHLKNRCLNHDIHNIELILGEVEDPLLPEGTLDIAFMINVYHHLDRPVPLVRNIISSLKPKGILAIVERDPAKVESASSHATAESRLIKQVQEAGFVLVRIDDFLKEDNLYIFMVKNTKTN